MINFVIHWVQVQYNALHDHLCQFMVRFLSETEADTSRLP